MISITLDPAKLFENGKTAVLVNPTPGVSYYDVGNGAHWNFTTDARYMEIDTWVTQAGGDANRNNCLGLRINDGSTTRDYWYAAPVTAPAMYTFKCFLPAGAGKTVQLFMPMQNAVSAGGAPKGVYPFTVRFDVAAIVVDPSLGANHLVIYGDSIASGGVAICPPTFGYAGLMKKGLALGGYNGSVTLVAHGFRRLADDCSTAGARTTFVALLLALLPTKILLTIGSNDQAVVPNITLANFTTYYTGLLDEIHSQSASMPIVCLSPIRRTTEAANGNGETMAQFRSAISSAVTARGGWAVPPTYVDGLAIFADLTNLPDGIHPNTAGAAIMETAVLAAV